MLGGLYIAWHMEKLINYSQVMQIPSWVKENTVEKTVIFQRGFASTLTFEISNRRYENPFCCFQADKMQ